MTFSTKNNTNWELYKLLWLLLLVASLTHNKNRTLFAFETKYFHPQIIATPNIRDLDFTVLVIESISL